MKIKNNNTENTRSTNTMCKRKLFIGGVEEKNVKIWICTIESDDDFFSVGSAIKTHPIWPIFNSKLTSGLCDVGRFG